MLVTICPVMRLEMMSLILMMSWSASSVDPETGGTVQRLVSQQDLLIQPGLSFINNSNMASVSMISMADIHNMTSSHHQLSCSINLVNWSRWLLGYPVHYFKYGHFQRSLIRQPFTLELHATEMFVFLGSC